MSNLSPCHIFFTPSFRFGKVHISWFILRSDRFPCGCVHLTLQRMHLSVAHENSTPSDSEFPLILLSGFPWSMKYPQTFGCNRTFRWRGTCRKIRRQVRRYRFRLWHTFFPFCSCTLFAIVLGQLIKLKFWTQQRELKWLMLDKWRRLFHSSPVTLTLGQKCLRVGVWCQCIKFEF